MDTRVVKINKVEEPDAIPKNYPIKPVETPKLEGGKKKRKTLKTYPRGILKTSKVKIKPVSDPAKHPPIKKGLRRHTIRLLTDSGVSQRRKTIKQKLARMSDQKVREIAMKAGLSKGNAPPILLRQIVEGGMISGFVSSD
jgi:hypothetical protein